MTGASRPVRPRKARPLQPVDLDHFLPRPFRAGANMINCELIVERRLKVRHGKRFG